MKTDNPISNPNEGKIAKIIKLFLEFVVAAVTAWLTASCVKLM